MQRRILIIDDHDDLASSLDEVFTHTGHEVQVLERRVDALAIEHLEDFDLVITDLDVHPGTAATIKGDAICLPDIPEVEAGEHVKAFKLCAANYRREEFDEEELKNLVATILDYKIKFVDTQAAVAELHENIEFELPSALSLMHIVLEYLLKRVEKLGVINPEQSNLFVALDEAFVNAVKHGNKFDAQKLVRITAEVSKQEAKFTIEDEGEGFDVKNIPDPLDPENLFKTSGRGVLFIYNIMDEVQYNDRGNRLTMVKKAHPDEEHTA
ncbi:MAG: ATP-binding protein [Chloracidobacterium sp.]|nr:ATP-binding protein [Chloracidobacterium sp.]